MVLGSQIQNLALFLSLCESFHPTRFRQRCGGFIPMVLFPIGFLRFRSRFETVRFLSRHLYEFAFSKSKKRFQTWTWDPGETGSDCTEHRTLNRLCPDFTPSIPDAEESRRRPFDYPEWIIDGILTRSFFGALIGYNNELTKLVFKHRLFAVPHSTLNLPNIQIFRSSGIPLLYLTIAMTRFVGSQIGHVMDVDYDENVNQVGSGRVRLAWITVSRADYLHSMETEIRVTNVQRRMEYYITHGPDTFQATYQCFCLIRVMRQAFGSFIYTMLARYKYMKRGLNRYYLLPVRLLLESRVTSTSSSKLGFNFLYLFQWLYLNGFMYHVSCKTFME